jgi:hypothetical protein
MKAHQHIESTSRYPRDIVVGHKTSSVSVMKISPSVFLVQLGHESCMRCRFLRVVTLSV